MDKDKSNSEIDLHTDPVMHDGNMRNVNENEIPSDKKSGFDFDDIIPMDKLQNGVTQASKFLSFGVEKIKTKAVEVNAELEKNENFQKLKIKTQEGFERTKEEVQKLGENFNENVKPVLEEKYRDVKKKVEDSFKKKD
eukprot:snap_masked-scaffold_6-processed-gene-15.48-mRNA-1 protein AED:1.00 eAED:1.00 QI:0/-1/0/0/-1/1/1/0/137